MDIRSRGLRIHYEAHGRGPALLLIHGMLQSSQRWIEQGYFEEFGGLFRVVAPDLIGHGLSDKPHDSAAYTIDGHLADLMAVLDAEGLDRVAVWGYSAGAAVAAALVLRHPESVSSVVVGGIPPNLPPHERARVTQPWVDALRRSDWQRFWETFLPISEPARGLLQERNDPVAVAAFVEGLAATAPQFSTLGVPSLCYEGSEEVFFEMARTTAEAAGSEFAVLNGYGHDDAFIDLHAVAPTVRDFLSRSVNAFGDRGDSVTRNPSPTRR